ncbi:hypothetical protein PIN31115_02069 [Pandoraea iniqua]|uniref:Uncharacterized protein n=1 Tax=Pandoraea iniqua TaxID=2508288 RepID=A0A5E4UK03_9BURK|nr:hypothetical protein [Pandoraea iniqua]VVE00318.1 hypothetical protein PIN31115_02069 [Pandoraea iniqua]
MTQGIGNNNLGSVASNVIEPIKRIPDQLSEAHEAVSALLDAVERVSMRVSSISDGAPPEAIEGTSAITCEPECVAAIDYLIGRIRLATARAHSVADRVRL